MFIKTSERHLIYINELCYIIDAVCQVLYIFVIIKERNLVQDFDSKTKEFN